MDTLQQTIIQEMGVKPEINPKKEIKQRVSFLVDYLEKSGAKGYILGISGGQDSLLAGILAQKAVEKRRKMRAEAAFCALLLPYGVQRDREDAELAIKTIRPDSRREVNIKPAVDAMVDQLSLETPVSDFNKGNIKARQRMIAHYAIAAEHGLLVIGTDHAAESVTGFFTKYGDGGVDLSPLAGLNKRQGRAMLEALGAPARLIDKVPTADLLDENAGRPDTEELGVDYDEIDDYLEGKKVAPEAARRIEELYRKSKHKRSMPAAFHQP